MSHARWNHSKKAFLAEVSLQIKCNASDSVIIESTKMKPFICKNVDKV